MRFRFPAPPLAALVTPFLALASGPCVSLWSETPAVVASGDRLRVRSPSLTGGQIEGCFRK